MKFKLSGFVLMALLFFFSSSYAQEWSGIPRSSNTSNYWGKKHQVSKYPGSKFRSRKNRGHRQSRAWNHKFKHRKRHVYFYNPIYSRYSGLGYPRDENESFQKLVIELIPAESYESKEPLAEEKKEFKKPKMETVSEEALATAESIDQSSQEESNGITIVSSEGSIQIDKNVRVRSLESQGSPIEIYSSD